MITVRCLDVETSGLDPAVHGVVEIATVDVRIMDNSVVQQDNVSTMRELRIERGDMWSSLINPGHEIPPQASAVHDIVDDMVKDAPMLPNLYPRIKAGSPDYFCAHNSRFDERFVKVGPWLDTYRVALWLWPSAPEHKLATLRYWLKLNLDISITSSHRAHSAFFDAYVCAAVLRRAFTAGATIEQMVEVSSQPALLPRLYFGKWAKKPIEDVDSGYLDWMLSQKDMDEDSRHTAFAEIQRRRNLDRLQT